MVPNISSLIVSTAIVSMHSVAIFRSLDNYTHRTVGLLLGTNSETPARLRSDIFSALLIPLHSVSRAVLDLFSHDLLFGVLALLPNVDVPSFPLLGNIHK